MMEALQINTQKRLDRKAFEDLYEKYYGELLKKFVFLIGSQEKAEDIIQEVFLKVWQQRDQIDSDLSIKAYMTRIGHNLIMDYYRHTKVEKGYLNRVKKSALLSFINEEELFHEDKRSRLERIIDKLPPKRKKIFRLCKFEEMSYKEVSTLLEISCYTISDHIVKANRFIKSEFHKQMWV